MSTGFVSIIGAGPGDPELLTLKALRRLQEAEVVLYDYLVNPELLDHCRREANILYVGKQAQRHSMSQAQINALLVEYGQAGYRVVRLKGGDPYIFGRGAEEAEALQDAGVPWELVPGISSAVAVPAYAGIPLTHRRLASSCTIMTGHEALDSTRGINWALGQSADTLVILMGLGRIRAIAERLVAHGRPETTPVAVIRWGTTAAQTTVVGTLATIADQVAAQELQSPAVIVVGEVVTCYRKLSWFNPAPAARAEPLALPQPVSEELPLCMPSF